MNAVWQRQRGIHAIGCSLTGKQDAVGGGKEILNIVFTEDLFNSRIITKFRQPKTLGFLSEFTTMIKNCSLNLSLKCLGIGLIKRKKRVGSCSCNYFQIPLFFQVLKSPKYVLMIQFFKIFQILLK